MKKILPSSIKFKISLGFILAFIVFIGVQLLSNKSIENLKESFKQISDSRLFLNRIGSASASIKSYYSKITEFVLTDNEKFLAGSAENMSDASINLQNISDAPVSPEQKILVGQLDSLINAVVKYCEQTLIIYDKEKRNDVIAFINTGEGEKLINAITDNINQIRQLEENNLVRIMHDNDSFSKNVSEMDYAGTAFAILVILFSIFILFRDINKRIKIEQQLRIAQQKSEQSAKMKEQFMANMSHEIRTPLNAIIGFANFLTKSNLDNKQKKQVSAIQSSGENLLNIINDILDFSKIEAGKVNIEMIPFSPAALMHSVNIMFLPKANDKKIQLDFYTTTNLPETVIGDPTRLTQILVNLINNALKFTSEGSIAIKTEMISEENENVIIQFTVKDTGIGIPSDKLNEIFDRFTQANTDTSRKYGGSGLGLSITKKLVELQGGYISVQSAEGVGSSFSFFIPYKKTTRPVLISDHRMLSSPIHSKINILVAEDNLLNQNLAEALLTQWGYVFDIVENGKQAIENLKKKDYDLVLMDIQMPEMNGYEASQYIRQNLHLKLPVIAMTAHVLPGEKEKCMNFGMTDYISKPIRENELFNLIDKYVGKNSGNTIQETKINQSTGQNSNVINLDYVNELANGNLNFVNEMIDLFLTEIPKEIRTLESAIQKKDIQVIAAIAHKINSTIPFVGLNLIIGNQLSLIERLAENSMNIPRIKMLFIQINEVCLKAIEELNKLKTNQS